MKACGALFFQEEEGQSHIMFPEIGFVVAVRTRIFPDRMTASQAEASR